MKRLLIVAMLVACSAQAQVQCFGSGSFRTCTDLSSGNTYNVQKFGNMTNIQGSNPYTGSQWNQTSQTLGNSTFHNGTAANGNSWSGSTMNLGNTQIHQGTDSRGQSYFRTCNQFGCF